MEFNLRQNIINYKETNDKNILGELIIYFNEYINNIARKINSEYANTDLIIGFIEIINKIDIKQYSDEILKKIIVSSLVKKRIDIYRKNRILIEEFFFDDTYRDSSSTKDDLSNIYINDLIQELNFKQRKVIEFSFIEGKIDVEISYIMNITKQSVGQLKARALKNLKNYIDF